MITLLGWLAVVLGLTGAILNARKVIYGFHIWIISNAVMIYIYVIESVGLPLTEGKWYGAILFFMYLLLSIYGIKQWGKNKVTVNNVKGEDERSVEETRKKV